MALSLAHRGVVLQTGTVVVSGLAERSKRMIACGRAIWAPPRADARFQAGKDGTKRFAVQKRKRGRREMKKRYMFAGLLVLLVVVAMTAVACGSGGDHHHCSSEHDAAPSTTAAPSTETTAAPSTETTAAPSTETTTRRAGHGRTDQDRALQQPDRDGCRSGRLVWQRRQAADRDGQRQRRHQRPPAPTHRV